MCVNVVIFDINVVAFNIKLFRLRISIGVVVNIVSQTEQHISSGKRQESSSAHSLS